MNRGEAYERAAALYDTAVRHHIAHCKDGGRGGWVAVTTEPAAYARRVLRIAEFLAGDPACAEPADDQATAETFLRALLAQLELDKGSAYWAEREKRGAHRPGGIEAWLSSLIDASWTPEQASS